MSLRLLCGPLAAALVPLAAFAGTTLVEENFDNYADTTAMQAVWRPDDGNGFQPLAGPVGLLIPDGNLVLTPPNDNPPGLEGKGVNILSDVNEYVGPAKSLLETLVPTENQAIRLTMDFYDHASGNKRHSVGLRHAKQSGTTVTSANIIELGMWNAADSDPTDPDPANVKEVSTGYAYRVVLFGALGGNLLRSPNWGYFPLNPVLDRPDDADELVNVADIGRGWHRYTATISPTDVTFTLDLFRDGLANTEAVAGVGAAGVDATVTWPIAPATSGGSILPFNSLRFGAPSGVANVANDSVIDNIKLELVDLAVPLEGDFNGDQRVDDADFAAWQTAFGAGKTGADLLAWQRNYGAGASGNLAAAPVPEPAAAALALAGLAAAGARRRR